MLGLELPYRVLAYAEGDESLLAYADQSFIRERHGIDDSVSLDDYENDILQSIRQVDDSQLRPVSAHVVSRGYGIVSITSRYDFPNTLKKLEEAIMSQGDTVWFGDVDFQSDAAELGITLRPSTMLLFGGPGPGGMAMSEYPRLGLDAFCQKLLVLEDEQGAVMLHFNDIVALAELHYGSSNKPQAVINQRLLATLTGAVAG